MTDANEGIKILRDWLQLIRSTHPNLYIPAPVQPVWKSTGCPVCGLGQSNEPMAYACSRNDCPTKAIAGKP